jgi:hypothetical protein
VVGVLQAGQPHKPQVFLARLADAAGTKALRQVAIGEQFQEHFGGKSGGARPLIMEDAFRVAQVQRIHHLINDAHEMVRGNPIIHSRR